MSKAKIHLRAPDFRRVPDDSVVRLGPSACLRGFGTKMVYITGDPAKVSCADCKKKMPGFR